MLVSFKLSLYLKESWLDLSPLSFTSMTLPSIWGTFLPTFKFHSSALYCIQSVHISSKENCDNVCYHLVLEHWLCEDLSFLDVFFNFWVVCKYFFMSWMFVTIYLLCISVQLVQLHHIFLNCLKICSLGVLVFVSYAFEFYWVLFNFIWLIQYVWSLNFHFESKSKLS